MINLNLTQIIGNIGSTPEMRFTANGKLVTSFSVAINRQYTDSGGEKKENTEWFNVVTWGKLAESCNQYLNKGMLVYVAGRVEIHRWQSKDGVQRSSLQLTATQVIFLSRSSNGNNEEIQEVEPEEVPF